MHPIKSAGARYAMACSGTAPAIDRIFALERCTPRAEGVECAKQGSGTDRGTATHESKAGLGCETVNTAPLAGSDAAIYRRIVAPEILPIGGGESHGPG